MNEVLFFILLLALNSGFATLHFFQAFDRATPFRSLSVAGAVVGCFGAATAARALWRLTG